MEEISDHLRYNRTYIDTSAHFITRAASAWVGFSSPSVCLSVCTIICLSAQEACGEAEETDVVVLLITIVTRNKSNDFFESVQYRQDVRHIAY